MTDDQGNGNRFRGWTEANMERLFAEIAALKATLDCHQAAQDKRFASMEKKLADITVWRAYVLGVAAGVSAIVSMIAYILGR